MSIIHAYLFSCRSGIVHPFYDIKTKQFRCTLYFNIKKYWNGIYCQLTTKHTTLNGIMFLISIIMSLWRLWKKCKMCQDKDRRYSCISGEGGPVTDAMRHATNLTTLDIMI